MNDPLDAEIAAAVKSLQAVLPNPDDVRLDWVVKMVEIGRYPVGRLVAYMQSRQDTPAEILGKLVDMLDEHSYVEPVEPAAAITEEPVDADDAPVDDDPGPDGVRPE